MPEVIDKSKLAPAYRSRNLYAEVYARGGTLLSPTASVKSLVHKQLDRGSWFLARGVLLHFLGSCRYGRPVK